MDFVGIRYTRDLHLAKSTAANSESCQNAAARTARNCPWQHSLEKFAAQVRILGFGTFRNANRIYLKSPNFTITANCSLLVQRNA